MGGGEVRVEREARGRREAREATEDSGERETRGRRKAIEATEDSGEPAPSLSTAGGSKRVGGPGCTRRRMRLQRRARRR